MERMKRLGNDLIIKEQNLVDCKPKIPLALLSEDITRANEPLKLLQAGALENQ